jgi:hypothetical protein
MHGAMSVILDGYKSLSLILTEECRFRVFENRTLTKIFGPKMEKVIVDWRELHNEELHG